MYADVLVLFPESNYDQIYTYSIDAKSYNKYKNMTGFLVVVPLRNKAVQGIIIKTYSEKPELSVIKPLTKVLSTAPLLNDKTFLLAKWVSSYYACSLNKVMSLFLPPAVKKKEKEIFVLNREKLKECLFLSEKEKEIVQYVDGKRTGVTLQSMRKKFGDEGEQSFRLLLKEELLIQRKVFSSPFSDKEKQMVALREKAPPWQEIERAPRQAEIIKALEQGPQAIKDLKKLTPSIYGVIKAIQNKGWVKVYSEKERRIPTQDRLLSQRPLELNEEQKRTVAALSRSISLGVEKKFLLYGVTGSGKTEVYLQAIKKALECKRQILYLVPEIALTSQITSLLLDSFGKDVALIHSALSPGERYDEWMRIRKGEAKIVLGPRSAIFAPFADLGLIIVDEEHENAYKQNEPDPRYDARKAAGIMAKLYQATLVFGSATPSLRAYQKAQKGEYHLLTLPNRVASRPMPRIKLVDMKKELREGNRSIFSRELLSTLEDVIARKEQAMLFLNRRGFHTYVFCRECGDSLICPHCNITLTYHAAFQQLTCHYCNYQRPVPNKCPSCGSAFIRYFGTGTERVAKELEKVFPDVSYLRMDADTTRSKGSHSKILRQFQEKKAQILIGTQMIAKGLDFPEVTFVGIISADTLLNMPDYQAGERAYQLLTQVAGRAGRGHKRGEVLIQTYNPEHYLFPAVIKQNYEEFYNKEMDIRLNLEYPPFSYLVRILISGFKEKKVLERVDYLRDLLKIEIGRNIKGVEVLGPSPAPLVTLRGRYRYHLVLKGKNLRELQNLAHIVRREANKLGSEPRTIIDVEPQTLL